MATHSLSCRNHLRGRMEVGTHRGHIHTTKHGLVQHVKSNIPPSGSGKLWAPTPLRHNPLSNQPNLNLPTNQRPTALVTRSPLGSDARLFHHPCPLVFVWPRPPMIVAGGSTPAKWAATSRMNLLSIITEISMVQASMPPGRPCLVRLRRRIHLRRRCSSSIRGGCIRIQFLYRRLVCILSLPCIPFASFMCIM